jgi:nitroreductase
VDLYEAMRSTPTTRRFTDEPVPREALLRVLENARFAPSGGNRQGWRVIAVEDRERRRTLRDLYLPHWRAYIQATGAAAVLERPDEFPASVVRMARRSNEMAEHLDEIPLHLIVLVHLDSLAITDSGLERPSVVGGASVYPFVMNVLLGLRAEGLGAALTTLIVPAEPQLRTLLEIPDGYAVAGHIAAGHPAEPWPTRLSRRPVEEFAFLERYGEPFAATPDGS